MLTWALLMCAVLSQGLAAPASSDMDTAETKWKGYHGGYGAEWGPGVGPGGWGPGYGPWGGGWRSGAERFVGFGDGFYSGPPGGFDPWGYGYGDFDPWIY